MPYKSSCEDVIYKGTIFYPLISTIGKGGIRNLPANPENEKDVSILFVHGYGSSDCIWYPPVKKQKQYIAFAQEAANLGYDVWTISLSDPKHPVIETLAEEELYVTLKRMIKKKPNNKIWIVAHSLGGLIVRYLTEFAECFEPISSYVEKICFLATPHHGLFYEDIKKLFTSALQSVVMVEGQAVATHAISLIPELKKNMEVVNHYFELLNQNGLLNPQFRYKNAVAKLDLVVGCKSQYIEENELKNGVTLEQKEFLVDHMEYPFLTPTLNFLYNLVISNIGFLENIFVTEKIKRLPINRSRDVFNWIFDLT